MRLIFVLGYFLALYVKSYSQSLDYVWLFGYSSAPNTQEWGGTIIDFNEIPPDIRYQFMEMNFLESNASICDSNGNLIFYTNGIYAANKYHDKIENSDGLNPGIIAQDFGEYGYPLTQGTFILPRPIHSDIYFLIHATVEYSTPDLEVHCSKLLYTKIDISLNGGLGKVTDKNKTLIQDTLGVGKLTAAKNGNGRDWWILMHERSSNRYYRIRFSKAGLHFPESDAVGQPIPGEGIGQAVFSPDGSIYARYNTISFELGQYLEIFDFDRCTGELSNQRIITDNDGSYSGGLAISPNSRYLYVSSWIKVYQYDLWANDIAASKQTIAEYDSFLIDFTPTTFFLAQLAPDGKIYINSNYGTQYFHVIHQPNLPYPYCNLEQHGIHLPTYNAFSMPNFPNYRLGPLDGSPCDTLGLDNHPVAKFRYDQDTTNYLQVAFTDLSYYEPAAWHWDFGDGSTSQDTSPVHTFPHDGLYEVCLTVSNQYDENTFCRSLQIGEINATGEVLPAVKVILYPNPAAEAVNVILYDYLPRHAELRLYDALGKEVARQRLNGGWNVMPLEGIAPGVYFYQVRDGERRLSAGKLGKVGR